MTHTPVLVKEVLSYLQPVSGRCYIDATADGGGHSVAILKHLKPDGRLLALEWDEELFRDLGRRLKQECPQYSKNYILRRASFRDLARLVRHLKFGPVSGILFDLGLSSFHIERSRRGFSFRANEALDMRFSPKDLETTAADLVNRMPVLELARILKTYGEERFAERIAKRIGEIRKDRMIVRTRDLTKAIGEAVPSWYRRGRIHFATKTFQALRIAVNHEFENIAEGLNGASQILQPGGVLAVISFHSLEDRLVKQFGKLSAAGGILESVSKKPIRPTYSEVRENPRSRSAKMRVFRKL